MSRLTEAWSWRALQQHSRLTSRYGDDLNGHFELTGALTKSPPRKRGR